MKIIDVRELEIPAVKVIRFGRFCDTRGFFTETFRRSDLSAVLPGMEFVQMNESYSRAGVVRGLHFQWSPYMGKLVRTISGRMVDIFLDIRIGSKTFGQASMYDLPGDDNADLSEWIWVPPGFAHGNFFPRESRIEYLCSGEYGAGNESGISPLAKDIDWALCPAKLKAEFDRLVAAGAIMTEKDRMGFSVNDWKKDPRSAYFKV